MATTFVTIFALKNLPLVYVSLVNSTSPLWIVLFSFLLLNERLTKLYLVCLFAAFAGILMMILGSLRQEEVIPDADKDKPLLVPLLLLLLSPIIMSINVILLKQL